MKSIQAQTLEELKEHRKEHQKFVEDTRDRLMKLETMQEVHSELPARVTKLEAFRWKLGGGMVAASAAIGWCLQRFYH